MASGQLGAVVRQFHRLFSEGTVSGLSEAQLLSRFIDSRDQSAFEAIVSRFGPMVQGVCRKLIDDPHMADDAFQATFLVLVKRAATIRDRELLGNWLYGVALRVARKARCDLARRRSREKGGDGVTPEPIGDGPSPVDPDLGPILHEELARLPLKYRDPVVLCLLDGRTHEEAAGLLHWPVGTVKGRLSRAKDLLRSRLGRRGVTATVAAISATLAKTTEASVPPLLLDQTVKAAMGVAAGGAVAAGLCSAPAVVLCDGVVTTMILSKTKILAVGLALVGTLATGVGVMAMQGSGAGNKPNRKAAEKAEPGDQTRLISELRDFSNIVTSVEDLPPLKTLAARRVELAQKSLEAHASDYKTMPSSTSLDLYLQAARKLLDARNAAAETDRERTGALETYIRLARSIVEREKTRAASSIVHTPNLAEAQSALIDAEFELARLREGQTPRQGRAAAARGPGGATTMPPAIARAKATYESAFEKYSSGDETPETVLNALKNWFDLMIDLTPTYEARANTVAGQVRELEKVAEIAKGQLGGDGVSLVAEALAQAKRRQAEIQAGRGGPLSVAARLQPGGGLAEDDDDLARNQAILKELNKVVSMSFPKETPLEDVIKYVKSATQSDRMPNGLPLYLEPEGLQEAEKTTSSPVTFEIEDAKLKTSLRLILKQLGLGYYIKEGLVIITSLGDEDYQSAITPRRIMMGGGMGGMMGMRGGIGGMGGGMGGGGMGGGGLGGGSLGGGGLGGGGLSGARAIEGGALGGGQRGRAVPNQGGGGFGGGFGGGGAITPGAPGGVGRGAAPKGKVPQEPPKADEPEAEKKGKP